MRGLFIGLTSVDIIYTFDHFLEENAKHKTDQQLMDIGGPATNAAFAFSALGGDATLISLIGEQSFSEFMRKKLKSYRINHIDLNPDLNQRPEISSIIVNSATASRTIATVKPLKDIPLNIQEINLKAYDVICVDGFYGKYVLSLLQKNRLDIPIVFDGGSEKPYTKEILSHVSYPIFSERFSLKDETKVEEHLSTSTFAITKGEKPIEVWDGSKKDLIKVPNIKAIDTLGAGDIFHGAFSWYILQKGVNFKSALSHAAKIASESCKYTGTREWAR